MRLAHAAQDINLGAVVRGIESDFVLVECFGADSCCVLTGSCRLARVLDDALSNFLLHLDRFTLQDILPVPNRPAALEKRVTLRHRASP